MDLFRLTERFALYMVTFFVGNKDMMRVLKLLLIMPFFFSMPNRFILLSLLPVLRVLWILRFVMIFFWLHINLFFLITYFLSMFSFLLWSWFINIVVLKELLLVILLLLEEFSKFFWVDIICWMFLEYNWSVPCSPSSNLRVQFLSRQSIWVVSYLAYLHREHITVRTEHCSLELHVP